MESTPARTALLDPDRAVRVRRHLASQTVRRFDNRSHFFRRVLRQPGSSPSESTPPVAMNLITSAPYLMLVAHFLHHAVHAVGDAVAGKIELRREKVFVEMPAA